MTKDALIGCLLGTAAGDALGLPYEGLWGGRAGRIYRELGRHHFLLGRGMVSDDTEHACFTAQAVLACGGDAELFQRRLARSLRWWLAGLPAGVGWATLRAVLKLWLGWHPSRSGVFSAGNGPAMRGPFLGVAYGACPERLRSFVAAATEITHRDPKAYLGALASAQAAFESARTTASIEPLAFQRSLEGLLHGPEAAEFLVLLRQAAESAARGEATLHFAETIGCGRGVSGYIFHTIPCVIQTWLRHQDDFGGGVRQILEAGGDTDTTAAILGGIIGARVGKAGIPAEWLERIVEWPRGTVWMERLASAVAEALAEGGSRVCPAYPFLGLLPRNLFFLGVVLLHGFRRLAPPY